MSCSLLPQTPNLVPSIPAGQRYLWRRGLQWVGQSHLSLYRDICSSAPQENTDLGLSDPQSPQNPQVQMRKHLVYLTPFWKTVMNPMRPIPQSASSRPPSYRFPFCRAYTQTLVHSGLKDHTQHRLPWKNPLVYLIKQKIK